MKEILNKILTLKQKNEKALAVLIDPDSLSSDALKAQLQHIKQNEVDFIFVGGSMITDDCLDDTLTQIKVTTDIPTIIFPGSIYQINAKADAILFLSLISGRNSELLIGKHVLAAPMLKKSGIEVLPTGYMLVESGQPTTASYISGTLPLPNNKPNIAATTALAGEMLGLKLNFLDAGSGAKNPVHPSLIKKTADLTDNPLIVGGGIRSAQQAKNAWDAGADLIVIGTAFETDPTILSDIAAVKP